MTISTVPWRPWLERTRTIELSDTIGAVHVLIVNRKRYGEQNDNPHLNCAPVPKRGKKYLVIALLNAQPCPQCGAPFGAGSLPFHKLTATLEEAMAVFEAECQEWEDCREHIERDRRSERWLAEILEGIE